MMGVVDQVEHREDVYRVGTINTGTAMTLTFSRTEFELREGGVAICDTLNPLRLVGLAVERQPAPGAVRELCKVLLLLPLVLRPAPEPDLQVRDK